MQPKRLWLVRHGETEGQSSVRYHGAGDVLLSSLGRGQIEAAVPALAGELRGSKAVAVVASPMARALESAGILLAGLAVHGVHPTTVDRGFADADWLAYRQGANPSAGVERTAKWVRPVGEPSRVGSDAVPMVPMATLEGLDWMAALDPHGLALHPDFAEISFGRHEGLTAQEIEAADPEFHTAWQQQTVAGFPDGEPFAAFTARVALALDRVLEATCADDLVVVAHRGIVSRALQALVDPTGSPATGGPTRWAVDLGSVSSVIRDAHASSGWAVHWFNHTPG